MSGVAGGVPDAVAGLGDAAEPGWSDGVITVVFAGAELAGSIAGVVAALGALGVAPFGAVFAAVASCEVPVPFSGDFFSTMEHSWVE